jgi:DNA repair exonuclease SbcCD ATPase subunit
VNDVIEHYYHQGVAVNPKATISQLEKGREKLERLIAKLQEKNASLERKNESLEAKIDRLLARLDAMSVEIAELREHNARVLARLDKALSRNDHLAASVKRNVGRANLAGWHLMRQSDVIAEQEAEIESLTERVSVNRSAKMRYKAIVAEYKMAMERVREDMPGFKGKKVTSIPRFVRIELGKFLEATRECFQSVLEQKKLTEEFKVMTLALFPEMSSKVYDDFIAEFNEPLKPEHFVMDAEPVAKKLNHR